MEPASAERDWQNLLSGPVQHIGRLLSTPSVPGSCRLSFVCRAWRESATSTSGQQIIYRSRVAGQGSEQRDACFARWLEKNPGTVSSLTLVWLDSPNAPVAALCKAAAAAAAASKPLPLQRLVWTDSSCLYEEVAALLPNLPHLRHLDITGCQPFAPGALSERAGMDGAAHYAAALQALHSSRLRHLSMSLSKYHLLKPPSMERQLEAMLSQWLADNCSHLPTSLQSLQLDLAGLPVGFDASWLQHLVNLRHLALTGDATPMVHSWVDNKPSHDAMLVALLALPRLSGVHIACGGLIDSSTTLAPVSHLIKELAVTRASVLAGLGDYKALTGLDLDLVTVPKPLVIPPEPMQVKHLTISLQTHSSLKQGTTQVQQLQPPGTTATSSSTATSSNMLAEVVSVGQLHSLCVYDSLPEAGPSRKGVQGRVGPVNAATQLTALQLLLTNKAVQQQLPSWGPAVAALTALESLDAPLRLLDALQLCQLPFLGLRRLVLRVVPQEMTDATLQQLVVQLGRLGRLQCVRLEVMLEPWAMGASPAAAACQGVLYSCWEACLVLERGMPHVAVEVCRMVEGERLYSCPNQALLRAGL